MSEQLFVFKLIFRTRRKLSRQLGWKNFEQRPINLRSISKYDWRKKVWTKVFSQQTDLIDIQKAVRTTGPTNFRRNDRKNSLNAQWWIKQRTFSKKTSSKNHLGHVVSSFDKLADCFSEKSPNFFAQGTQMTNETNKVLTKRFYVLKLTLGLVECSVVHLAEKNSNKDWSICDQCP